jgi:hypothetical protein
MTITPRQLIAASLLGAIAALTLPCAAQTIQANPQAQTALTPAVGLLAPTPPILPIPATIAGTGESPGLNQTVTREKLSPSVGQRLPGMPGGPPLYTPMGAGDPTAAYMRPLVVGPLSCNLALDPACF